MRNNGKIVLCNDGFCEMTEEAMRNIEGGIIMNGIKIAGRWISKRLVWGNAYNLIKMFYIPNGSNLSM